MSAIQVSDQEFSEFSYRLVYLRPSDCSDERLVVGVVSDWAQKIHTRLVASSTTAVEQLIRLIGEDGVEQFQFAVAELRRASSGVRTIDDIQLPSDLFTFGDRQIAITRDHAGLIDAVLKSSSCLSRLGGVSAVEVVSNSGALEFKRNLYAHVTRLDPLLASDLFDRKVTVQTGESVQLPILGRKIFGAAISFASGDQRMRAEAFLAKSHWIRLHLPQKPRIYILGPDDESSNALRSQNNIREIGEIAKALDVPMAVSASTEDLAMNILRDEAA